MRRRLVFFAKYTAVTGVALFLFFLLLNACCPLHDHIQYSTVVTDRKGNAGSLPFHIPHYFPIFRPVPMTK